MELLHFCSSAHSPPRATQKKNFGTVDLFWFDPAGSYSLVLQRLLALHPTTHPPTHHITSTAFHSILLFYGRCQFSSGVLVYTGMCYAGHTHRTEKMEEGQPMPYTHIQLPPMLPPQCCCYCHWLLLLLLLLSAGYYTNGMSVLPKIYLCTRKKNNLYGIWNIYVRQKWHRSERKKVIGG